MPLSSSVDARARVKCYLASNLNRARFWLDAENRVEPEEEIRRNYTCIFPRPQLKTYPKKTVLNLAQFRMEAR